MDGEGEVRKDADSGEWRLRDWIVHDGLAIKKDVGSIPGQKCHNSPFSQSFFGSEVGILIRKNRAITT